MKKFIRKLGLFLLILSVICVILTAVDVLVIKNQYDQGYNAAINDKLDRLQSIDEPKIIIVGNSNLAFGIRSERIEETFGMPVVNMGLHGGIGDAFYEELVKPYINEGDIVIVAPNNYESNSFFDDKSLAMTMLEKNRRLWEPLSTETKRDLLLAYPYYSYSCWVKWITHSGNKGAATSYSRDAFNEYGDVIKRPAAYDKTPEELFGYEGVLQIPVYDPACFDRINAYHDFITAKGAVLLLSVYPVADCQWRPDVEEYEAFENVLRENLDCPIISKYEDYIMDPDYFYDTILHLTQDGAELRTEQLIQDLKQYLSQAAPDAA